MLQVASEAVEPPAPAQEDIEPASLRPTNQAFGVPVGGPYVLPEDRCRPTVRPNWSRTAFTSTGGGLAAGKQTDTCNP